MTYIIILVYSLMGHLGTERVACHTQTCADQVISALSTYRHAISIREIDPSGRTIYASQDI